MRYRILGGSKLKVSEICLGTMTFGEQNTAAEAHQLLDLSMDYGVNFIDTAEMYPIPPRVETYGRTEEILGGWLHKNNKREKVILASKVVGRSDWLPHIRDGKACLDRKNIELALENSLRRLRTDYLDLYQLHWPDRPCNFFGELGYCHQKSNERVVDLENTLAIMGDFVKTGKVRYIGVSNETPWGVMKYLQLSDKLGLPRIVSIQNPYNLLNRSFEVGLAEISMREKVGLLAYSPMAFGVLSGKYLAAQPANARLTLFPAYQRYTNMAGLSATSEYVALAQKFNIKPAQMALAFVNRQDFVNSNIIGATSIGQLRENLESIDVQLPEELLLLLDRVQKKNSNPCP